MSDDAEYPGNKITDLPKLGTQQQVDAVLNNAALSPSLLVSTVDGEYLLPIDVLVSYLRSKGL